MDGASGGSVASCRAILDKPLSQLTEDDISQLTREDCRKFLKEKGMRKPSWNKSQAIQQVISLKALMENTDDSDTGGDVYQVIVTAPDNVPVLAFSNSGDSAKEPNVSGDIRNKAISNGLPGEGNSAFGQMTIFYSGKVNVYDGVPTDKARALLNLAATPIDFHQDGPLSGTAPFRAPPCRFQAMNDIHAPLPPTTMMFQASPTDKMAEYSQEYREKGNFTRDVDLEVQMSRKVSVQRFREKRNRDRFLKSKRSHQIQANAANGQPNPGNRYSPTQAGLPHLSADNQANITSLCVDLNNEDV